jgi:L-asparaginase
MNVVHTPGVEIKIFTTGGTIDKIYFDALSEFQIGEAQIGQVLNEANVSFAFDVEPLMRKDSLELTDDDRALIARHVRNAACQRIIVTHGTDTMVETARYLGRLDDRSVVFTGAMQPARLRVTDALFNIGFAVAAVQTLPRGVWIAMNGRVLDASSARKNRAENRFEGESPLRQRP